MKLKRDYAHLYRRMYQRNAFVFGGRIKGDRQRRITELVRKTGANALLDYGCGRGMQYLVDRVHEEWGTLPYCFDVGIPSLSAPPPDYAFNGIICTDVMEHIDEVDVPRVVADIFRKLCRDGQCFVYFFISCRPAKKYFADGSELDGQIHLTIRSPEWWTERIFKHERDGLIIKVDFDK